MLKLNREWHNEKSSDIAARTRARARGYLMYLGFADGRADGESSGGGRCSRASEGGRVAE